LDWNEYNDWNRRAPNLRLAWFDEIKIWISENYSIPHESEREKSPNPQKLNLALLDYGCGHFDLGQWLSPHFEVVDGFDPHAPSIDEAAQKVKGKSNRLYKSKVDIPTGTYDLIILHSVMQYFSGEAEIKDFLSLAHTLLKGPAGLIVITDIIPTDYSPLSAILHSAVFALKKKIFWTWLNHIWRASTKPSNLKLLQIDFDNLESIASSAGFTATKLGKNLSPATHRYSVVLCKKI
jgi:2-polyprenyl-3-methyl-5-hydroxy-6-metoxy-1,4-benzoquinol methylase